VNAPPNRHLGFLAAAQRHGVCRAATSKPRSARRPGSRWPASPTCAGGFGPSRP